MTLPKARLFNSPRRSLSPWIQRFVQPGPAERLILQTARQQWPLLAINLFSSLLEAFGEGAALAVVFLAVQVLSRSAEQSWASNPLISRLPGLLSWMDSTPRVPLFLVLLAVSVLLQLLLSGCRYLNAISVSYLAARSRARVTSRIQQQILGFSFACASRYRVGDLTDLLALGPDAVSSAIGVHGQLLINLLLAAVYLGVLMVLSPWLLLMAAAMAMLVVWVQRRLLPRIRESAQQVSADQLQIASVVTEQIQGLRLLHSLGQLDQAQQAVSAHMAQLERSLRRQSQLIELIGPISQLLPIIAIAVLGAASLLVFGDKSSGILPSLVTFVLALQRLNIRLSGIARLFTERSANAGRMQRLDGFLQPHDKQFRRQGGIRSTGLRREIRLDGVDLCYPGSNDPVLRALDLTIPCGSTVALVGPSGAGKSSLVDLLIGLYSPSAGRVLIDGEDLETLNLISWQQHLGVVSQDTFLFNATIAENLAFGCPNVSEEQIQSALSTAQCSGFISALPDGIHTLVGERGYRLSGGQRQRLALARAILRRPDLLILDEATSALDSNNERLVQKAYERLRGSCTVLMIAHRLSTVVNADQIIVMQEGRIVQRGNHAQLLALDGLYRSLWLDQSQHNEIDPQTGTWNERYLLRLIDSQTSQSRRYHVPLTLFVLSPERDHEASPLMSEWKHLVDLLRSRLRETDQIGCMADGRLVLLLPYTTAEVAERVRLNL